MNSEISYTILNLSNILTMILFYCRFFSKRDAEDSMDKLDGTRVDGREIRIQLARYARPEPSRGGDRDRGDRGDRERDRRDGDRDRDRNGKSPDALLLSLMNVTELFQKTQVTEVEVEAEIEIVAMIGKQFLQPSFQFPVSGTFFSWL